MMQRTLVGRRLNPKLRGVCARSAEICMPNEPQAQRNALRDKLDELLLQQRELSQHLLQGQDQFKRLARSVWMAQEQERRKLARELHDGIGQNLTAIINLIGLALARPEPQTENLEKARALAEMTLRETR